MAPGIAGAGDEDDDTEDAGELETAEGSATSNIDCKGVLGMGHES